MQNNCKVCKYLNKSKKQSVGKAYRYGCGFRKEGYISTWINTDRLLDQISCNTSMDKEKEIDLDNQMTIDDWIKKGVNKCKTH